MDLYFSKNAALRFRFPVTPRAVTITTPGRGRTVTLIDSSEISILNSHGLSEVSFEALLPNRRYNFAIYPDGVFQDANHYLRLLRQLEKEREPFDFILGKTLMTVSLESVKVSEDAEYGGDVMVGICLREARAVRLAVVKPEKGGPAAPPRPAPVTPAPKTYSVVKGDTLWGIAKRFLGNGTRWPDIYALNRDKIVNPNLIYAGQKLVLP